MLYVFLDIDGVLNVKDDKKAGVQDVRMFNVRRLAETLEDFYQVRFVLTSEWRKWFVLPDYCQSYLNSLQRYLRRYGMEVWDVTPEIPYATREHEIKEYIKKNKVERYIILDDEKHHYSPDCRELYLVNPNEGFGAMDMQSLYNKCITLYGDYCFKEIYEIEEEYEVESYAVKDEFDFDVYDVKACQEMSDGVAFTMKPTERFPDTGLALIRFWKEDRIWNFPGVVLTGTEYQNLRAVGINMVVDHGKFPAFLKGVECEINSLFPVKSVLDVLRFEANDTVSERVIEMAVNDYCAKQQR